MREFTVVVPCHDRAGLAIQVVTQLVRLGCPTIAVDDGSAPPIPFPPDPLLQVIPIPASGAATARNRGADAATSEWLVFTDSDTMWSDTTLEVLTEVLAETPSRTWIVGVTRIPDTETSVVANWMRRLSDRDRAQDPRAVSLATGLFACRRTEFLDAGGFLTSMTSSGGEDWELGQRARQLGYDLVLAPGWEAENRDAPFTFRRLLGRERNYQLQARRLRELNVPGADDWLVLEASGLRDLVLRALGTPAVVSVLDKVGTFEDRLRLGTVLHPIYRASVSGYLRSNVT
jgi:glycosyltransferase involved in cell wall biosynthesis